MAESDPIPPHGGGVADGRSAASTSGLTWVDARLSESGTLLTRAVGLTVGLSALALVLDVVINGLSADTTASSLLLPVLVAGVGGSIVAVDEYTHWRLPWRWTLLVVTAAAVLLTAGSLAVSEMVRPWPVLTDTLWWRVPALAAGYLVFRALRSRDARRRRFAGQLAAPPVPPPATDDEWRSRVAAILRTCHDYDDARVRTILRDAADSDGRADRSLAERHGRPEEFTAALPVDPVQRARRRAWTLTVCVGAGVVTWVVAHAQGWVGPGGGSLVIGLLLLWLIVSAWKGVRKARSVG